ncbi:MAG: FAD-binding protein [Nocardiopsaceae bacterium]|nr:FAD-binding protein [Nocardiopsaceae bacterium]
MRVLIVGAGIGGLTAALRLHHVGIDCAVYEQAESALRPPRPEILRRPCGTDAGFGVPQFSIHRGRLQGVLARAAAERLGPAAVVTGHRTELSSRRSAPMFSWALTASTRRSGRRSFPARGDLRADRPRR